MHRRRFLIASVSLATAEAFSIVESAGPTPIERDFLTEFVRQLFPAADSKMVGRAYLVAAPDEADLQVLLARLPRGKDGNSVAAAITQHIEVDFVNRDIVYLDGWLFSRTEARLCAISCLV